MDPGPSGPQRFRWKTMKVDLNWNSKGQLERRMKIPPRWRCCSLVSNLKTNIIIIMVVVAVGIESSRGREESR